jgi:hypothetical protein
MVEDEDVYGEESLPELAPVHHAHGARPRHRMRDQSQSLDEGFGPPAGFSQASRLGGGGVVGDHPSLLFLSRRRSDVGGQPAMLTATRAPTAETTTIILGAGEGTGGEQQQRLSVSMAEVFIFFIF